MTATFYLNGVPAGHIQFLPGGVPVVSPGVGPLLSRLPVMLFPFLDPGATALALRGLSGRDIVVPGVGTIRVEVRP